MKTVYKYPLVIDDYQKVTLPINAKLLCIKEQNGKLCLWALINKEETCTEQITIRCAGTGHPIKENVEYIDSIIIMGGNLVFHFFKVIEGEKGLISQEDNYELVEQKSAWSEDDERNLKELLYLVEADYLSLEEPHNRLINFLKSFKERVIVKRITQPLWKPSEEQINILNEVLNFSANHESPHWNDYIFGTLNNLIRQLKKLREE